MGNRCIGEVLGKQAVRIQKYISLDFVSPQSRVIVQQPGERSFHSFYQVCIHLLKQMTSLKFPRHDRQNI